MFKFVIDDTVCDMSSVHATKRSQTFRMNNLRHNPYVGSFHGKSFAMLSGNYYEFMHVIHE